MSIKTKYNLLFLSIPILFILFVPIVIFSNIIKLFYIPFVWFVVMGIYLYSIKCPNCGNCINGSKTFFRHISNPPRIFIPNNCITCGFDISNTKIDK